MKIKMTQAFMNTDWFGRPFSFLTQKLKQSTISQLFLLLACKSILFFYEQVYSEAPTASLLWQVCNTSTLWMSWLSRGSLAANQKQMRFSFFAFSVRFFAGVCLNFALLQGILRFYFIKQLNEKYLNLLSWTPQ